MNQHERAALRTPIGEAVASVLEAAANPDPDTSRARLTERLEAAGIPEQHHAAILRKYAEIAGKARDASRSDLFTMRQQARVDAVAMLRGMNASDDLLGDPDGDGGIRKGSDHDRHDRDAAARVLTAARGGDPTASDLVQR